MCKSQLFVWVAQVVPHVCSRPGEAAELPDGADGVPFGVDRMMVTTHVFLNFGDDHICTMCMLKKSSCVFDWFSYIMFFVNV